jgi:hypothetical protein
MMRIRMGLLPGLLLALAVGACGGGGGNNSGVASLGGAGSDPIQAALAYGRCMRRHGINIPDPQITAEGSSSSSPTGMSRNDPRLRAAEQACRQQGGGGGKR